MVEALPWVRRTRIKFCGITRAADARAASAMGVDAVGLVFFAGSPRAVGLEQARRITDALGPFVTVVGLFVNAAPAQVEGVLESVPVDLLQFHGDESRADCARYARPYIKAVAMRDGVELQAVADSYHDARGLLLDSWHQTLRGGTGLTFDWSRVPGDIGLPLIIAGGLDAGNAGEVVRRLRPWALDVSGGIESAKGIKDEGKMAAFIRGVRDVECEIGEG